MAFVLDLRITSIGSFIDQHHQNQRVFATSTILKLFPTLHLTSQQRHQPQHPVSQTKLNATADHYSRAHLLFADPVLSLSTSPQHPKHTYTEKCISSPPSTHEPPTHRLANSQSTSSIISPNPPTTRTQPRLQNPLPSPSSIPIPQPPNR